MNQLLLERVVLRLRFWNNRFLGILTLIFLGWLFLLERVGPVLNGKFVWRFPGVESGIGSLGKIRTLGLRRRFIFYLEEGCEIFHRHLPFGKIFENGVNKHFADVFAGKLFDISSHKHLAELYFINGSVAVQVELIKIEEGVRVSIDKLLQFMDADFGHLLLHLLLSRLITSLLLLLEEFSHHRDQLSELPHRDCLFIVAQLVEHL